MSAEIRRLAALLDAQSAMAATGLDRRALLTTVARHLCEMTGGDACLAELVDADGEIYQAAAANTLAEAGVPLPTESLAGHAFFHDQLIRWDYNGIAVHVPDAAIGRPSRSALTAPLSVDGERLGVVSVVAGREGAFGEGDRDSVRRICKFAAHQLLQIQRYEEAQRTSRLDPLTDLGNRRALDEALETELARHIRYNRQLSLCVVDLNGFKRINDTYGHAAGDRVLRQVAEHLTSIRGADSAFRLGGDEFAILMPETGEGEAELVARRLARRIRDDAFPETLSASWGVAQATDTDAQALVAEADRRLYARKRGENGAQPQQQATG